MEKSAILKIVKGNLVVLIMSLLVWLISPTSLWAQTSTPTPTPYCWLTGTVGDSCYEDQWWSVWVPTSCGLGFTEVDGYYENWLGKSERTQIDPNRGLYHVERHYYRCNTIPAVAAYCINTIENFNSPCPPPTPTPTPPPKCGDPCLGGSDCPLACSSCLNFICSVAPTATPIPTATPQPTATPVPVCGQPPAGCQILNQGCGMGGCKVTEKGYRYFCPATGQTTDWECCPDPACGGDGVPPTPTPTPPTTCLGECQVRGYATGTCRQKPLKIGNACLAGETDIGQDNCALNNVCCCSGVLPTPTPTPPKKTISGSIWFDENKDGKRCDAQGKNCESCYLGQVSINVIGPNYSKTKLHTSDQSCNPYVFDDVPQVKGAIYSVFIDPLPPDKVFTGWCGITTEGGSYHCDVSTPVSVSDAEVHFGLADRQPANLPPKARLLSFWSQLLYLLKSKIGLLTRKAASLNAWH